MSIQPLGDRVLVKVLETPEITASGIVLPDSAKEKKAEGEIIAIGNGKEVKELGLSIGDIVVFGKYSGDEIEIEGVEHKILKANDDVKESDVLAVVK